ncbi:DNA translocase FtsK 4TM domain-containing protein [Phycisphaeraceae bacterium D3-23]
MAKKRKRKPEPVPSIATALAAYRGVGWAIVAGVWLLLAAALVSYHPADAPNPAVGVHAATSHNWVGAVGAHLAYHLYAMLGPGVWVLMLGAAVYLYFTATRRETNQLALRGFGLVMMTVCISGLVALFGASYGWFVGHAPQGPGGLLALWVSDQLVERFNVLGSAVVLGVTLWVGAILTADKYVLALPKMLAEVILRACDIDTSRWPKPNLQIGERLASMWHAVIGRLPLLAGHGRGDWDGAETDLEDAADKPRRKPKAKVKVRRHGKKRRAAGEDAAEAIEAVANTEDDAEVDAPEAYTQGKQKFSPEELRQKMAQMPINFAPKADQQPMPAQEVDLSGYKFPELALLDEPESDFTEEQEKIVRGQAVALESALQEYKIEGEVVGIDSGPVITLFEVRLAPGTKASRLSGVSTDLARSLKAQNIRIVPNMAGKDTVGIEVPNLKRELVRIRELMQATPETAKMNLPMFLGKDASGNPLVEDLNKMPHMLIAGTTGSGKSVCMNSIIMSFLYTKRPDELKLVLVDPKMVEMSMFKNIPHLMCPVVTEMSKAAAILEWAVTKMDERYELLAEAGVRDIGTYNKLGWDEIKDRMEPATEEEAARIPKKLPYMVFVIDELADLMMTNKEVEGFIVRIAQKARAVGIHLILATQRPSANVVTGLIKSNMPCRICMKVSSGMDSRIVMDQKGGELLLGHGDMLFLSPRSSELTRAQGCLVDDAEVRKTVKFLKTISKQSFEPQLVQIKSSGSGGDDEQERDELFEKAVDIVIETRRGSVSLLQRRLTIGYSRSSRIIEQIAAAGFLGPYKGSQAREVVISKEEWEAMKLQAAADALEGTRTTVNATEESTGDNTPLPEPPMRYESGTALADEVDEDEEYEEEEEDDGVEIIDAAEEDLEDGDEYEADDEEEEDDEEYELVDEADEEEDEEGEEGEEYEEEDEDEYEDAEGEYEEGEADEEGDEEVDDEEEDEDGEWEYEYEEVDEEEDEEVAA